MRLDGIVSIEFTQLMVLKTGVSNCTILQLIMRRGRKLTRPLCAKRPGCLNYMYSIMYLVKKILYYKTRFKQIYCLPHASIARNASFGLSFFLRLIVNCIQRAFQCPNTGLCMILLAPTNATYKALDGLNAVLHQSCIQGNETHLFEEGCVCCAMCFNCISYGSCDRSR